MPLDSAWMKASFAARPTWAAVWGSRPSPAESRADPRLCTI